MNDSHKGLGKLVINQNIYPIYPWHPGRWEQPWLYPNNLTRTQLALTIYCWNWWETVARWPRRIHVHYPMQLVRLIYMYIPIQNQVIVLCRNLAQYGLHSDSGWLARRSQVPPAPSSTAPEQQMLTAARQAHSWHGNWCRWNRAWGETWPRRRWEKRWEKYGTLVHYLAMDQYRSKPTNFAFFWGWASINPSYFDVNKRGTR